MYILNRRNEDSLHDNRLEDCGGMERPIKTDGSKQEIEQGEEWRKKKLQRNAKHSLQPPEQADSNAVKAIETVSEEIG